MAELGAHLSAMSRRGGHLKFRQRAVRATGRFVLLLVLGSTPFLQSVSGDEVHLEKTVFQGTITGLSTDAVKLDTGYGVISVPYEDIRSVTTEKPVLVVHGDRGATTGRILGIEDGHLLVGDGEEGDGEKEVTKIELVTILEMNTGNQLEGFGRFSNRLRNYYRFWSANLDAGISYSDKRTDEIDVNLGFQIERRRKPTRLHARIDYTFGREKPQGQEANETDNEVLGSLKTEYDAGEKVFVFAANSFEYDEIDRISLRYIGGGGPGYRLFETDEFRLQVEVGGGYVYRRFFGGEREEYGAGFFGIEGSRNLVLGMRAEFSLGYLPSLQSWRSDYLIQSRATLSYPIHEYLSLNLTLRNTYDNTPDNDAEKNEFKSLISIAWRF